MQTPTRQNLQVRYVEQAFPGAVLCFVKCYRAPSLDIRPACCLFWFPFWSFLFHSPSQGPCCTSMCTFKGSNEKCRLESECAKEGMCNGATALCPASEPKENFTSCHSETQVCLGGVRWVHFSFLLPPVQYVQRIFKWRLFFPCYLLVWNSSALVPFVRSINWRYARVPLKMARMRQPSCATCAVWRKVSRRPQIAHGSLYQASTSMW